MNNSTALVLEGSGELRALARTSSSLPAGRVVEEMLMFRGHRRVEREQTAKRQERQTPALR